MPQLTLIATIVMFALPLLEIALLIKVGSIVGVWTVLAIIVTTAILGVTVVQQQGLGVARRMVERMRSGEAPVEPMTEGMLLLFAGACLISPGLITDCLGLILLIPPIRRFASRWIVDHHVLAGTIGRPGTTGGRWRKPRDGSVRSANPPKDQRPGTTIDGEFERIDDDKKDRSNGPDGS